MTTPYVEIGGKIVFMEEPADDNHHLTHAIPFRLEEKFVAALEKVEGARLKSIEGPLINGLWVATFVEVEISDKKLLSNCRRLFKRYLRENNEKEQR